MRSYACFAASAFPRCHPSRPAIATKNFPTVLGRTPSSVPFAVLQPQTAPGDRGTATKVRQAESRGRGKPSFAHGLGSQILLLFLAARFETVGGLPVSPRLRKRRFRDDLVRASKTPTREARMPLDAGPGIAARDAGRARRILVDARFDVVRASLGF